MFNELNIGPEPLLKWVGGKRTFAKKAALKIREYLDSTGGSLIEPFAGGAAMSLAVRRETTIADVNKELISFYRHVRDSPEGLAFGLSNLVTKYGYTEDAYYRVRDTLSVKTSLEEAARFLYLNRICYNGVYRVNKNGDFNVPYGKPSLRKPIKSLFPDSTKIRDVSAALVDATFRAVDFEVVVSMAGPGDIVYADPPYDGTYDSYTSAGFDQHDQWRLARCLLDAHKRGAVIICHNSDTPFVRECYAWAFVSSLTEHQAVNRRKAECVVTTTKPVLLEQALSG